MPIQLHQLGMSALFQDAPAFQVKYQIGPNDLVQVVSDQKSRAPLADAIESLEHQWHSSVGTDGAQRVCLSDQSN